MDQALAAPINALERDGAVYGWRLEKERKLRERLTRHIVDDMPARGRSGPGAAVVARSPAARVSNIIS